MTAFPDILNVWYRARLAGTLERQRSGRISFQYDPGWTESGERPLSLSLPVDGDESYQDADAAHHFFANLLPEGEARTRIVRELKIPDDDFELLGRIGNECAGALSILPVEHEPEVDQEWQLLTDEELQSLVSNAGRLWGNTGDEAAATMRLSLAGAQDKCAVVLRDGRIGLPLGTTPSTHILKFESPRFKHLSAYEVLTMRLAEAVGLPVAQATLNEQNGHRFVRIARYDRVMGADGQVVRLHQEDFCQALGIPHRQKYQEFRGPLFAECLNLLRRHSSEPALDIQHLLRWQVFNVLAGNSDGHAKNISLLYGLDGTLRLAPFYDLVCTRAIEGIDHRLAFSVGSAFDPGMVLKERWHELAEECDIGSRFMVNLVLEMADELASGIDKVVADFTHEYGELAALDRVVDVVRKQCRRARMD